MNALDKLMRKPTAKLTHIEYAIKQSYAYGSKTIAEPAADDLANIDAELSALRERVEALEAAGVALFQACADLPLPEMDRMENEINAMAAAIKAP